MEREQYARMFELEERNWWFRLKRDFVYGLVEKHAPPRESLTLVDLGCGTGKVLKACPLPVRRLGLELDAEAALLSRARGLEVARASCLELPLADGSVDVALALDVLEHLDDDERAMAEIRRVLRPDGCCVITVPAHPFLWSPHDEVLHHHRRYTRRGLADRLRRAGFLLRQLCYGFATPFPAACAVRWVRRATGRVRGIRGGTADDFMGIPAWMDRAIYGLCRWEVPVVRRGRLPVGISLVAACTPSRAG